MAEIFGTTGNDGIPGTTEDDIIHGLAGNDQLGGDIGNDTVYGDEGDDLIYGGDGLDHLYSGTGRDTLIGGAGADLIDASQSESASLYSYTSLGSVNTDVFADRDTLIGSAGRDFFYAGFNDDVTGGGEYDFLYLNLQGAGAGVTLDLSPLATGGSLSNGLGTVQVQAAVVHVTGTGFDDVVTGISLSPPFLSIGASMDGGAGNDSLTGGAASDGLWGGLGADLLQGGAGNDSLFSGTYDPNMSYAHTDNGTEADQLFGGDGDDILNASIGDSVDGGAGYDIASIDLSLAISAVSFQSSSAVTSSGTTVGGATIANIESVLGFSLPNFENVVDLTAFFQSPTGGVHEPTVAGGNQRDVIIGSAGNDSLYGNDGNDDLRGGIGNDRIEGGAGNDLLEGGVGNDAIYGGAGIDIVSYASAPGRIILNMTWGSRTTFSAGTDYLWDIEGAEGSAFNDVLTGNQSDNIITGLGGNDVLYGGNGNDTLNGGSGRDEVFGEAGFDTLSDLNPVAGEEDALFGGDGHDVYVVTSRNTSTIEAADQGTDEVNTVIPVYQLQANIEMLRFTDNATHGAGVGNALDNVLIGGTGRDDLFGRDGNDSLIGGQGQANSMFGQGGNDLYIVQATGDSIFEQAGEGIDSVIAEVASFVLPANVENLSAGLGSGFVGIGNNLGNLLSGHNGADFLSGKDGADQIYGGAGNDTLLGGAGADQFNFWGGESSLDRIHDFESGLDRIWLNPDYFFVAGTLTFEMGMVAATENSTILYDPASGKIGFDPDGSGAAEVEFFAQINIGQTLVLTDIVFI